MNRWLKKISVKHQSGDCSLAFLVMSCCSSFSVLSRVYKERKNNIVEFDVKESGSWYFSVVSSRDFAIVTVSLSLQVKNCSAATCATPLSPQKAAWRCTCASTLAPSLSNVLSVNFALERQATEKRTFNSTFGQTVKEVNPSGPPRLLVRLVRVRIQVQGRRWQRTRDNSRQHQKRFNQWVFCQHPTLTPTFISQPTQFWQDSLTRVCCNQDWWDRQFCLPLCQVGNMNHNKSL